MLVSSFCFAQSETEREQLKLVLEQLKNIEQIARQSEQSVQRTASDRYSFDYTQFNKDIEAVRIGVQNYLTPIRAQPREVVDLEATYQKEKKVPHGNE